MTAAPFRPIGYLLQRRADQPPEGDPGTGYDYVLAGNGVFIRAENPLLAATVPVAPAQVRGLAPLQPSVELTHGPIPQRLLHQALNAMQRASPSELFTAVTCSPEGEYTLVIPPQDASSCHVHYEPPPGAVVHLHSHGEGNAFFSGTDDRDEQGFALYGVAGRLHSAIRLSFRAGIYGHFHPIPVREIYSQ